MRGRALAERELRRAPMAAADRAERRRYARDRRAGAAAPGASYRFEPDPAGAGTRVSFPCPVCGQRLRLPVRGPVRARCGLCRTVLECDT